MEGPTAQTEPWTRERVSDALRERRNWEQLAKFGAVGAVGYLVNLGVYVLLRRAGVHYIPAAIGSFAVAVSNNYAWNRVWTFRRQRGHMAFQGLRFLIVSLVTLGANVLILYGLVHAGLGKLPAQALAIVLVMPLNFLGNKLWSFGRR
jgi:dolichol-phosphate mannosyltransferase